MNYIINSITIQQGVSYGTVEGKLVRFADQERTEKIARSSNIHDRSQWLSCANESCWDLCECQGTPLCDGIYQTEALSVEVVRQYKDNQESVPCWYQLHDLDDVTDTANGRYEYREVLTEQEKETKKDCQCTGPWDCQCEDTLKQFYDGPVVEVKEGERETIKERARLMLQVEKEEGRLFETQGEEENFFNGLCVALSYRKYVPAPETQRIIESLNHPAHSEESQVVFPVENRPEGFPPDFDRNGTYYDFNGNKIWPRK